MKVLVTGASGYLGCATVAALAQHGHAVCAIDQRWPHIVTAASYHGDLIRDFTREEIHKFVIESEAVIHLAAVSSSAAVAEYPYRAKAINVDLSIGLAHEAYIASIPFIFPSSAAVYGSGRSARSEDEVSSLSGRDDATYRGQKAHVERWLSRRSGPWKATILRLGTLYGCTDLLTTRFDTPGNAFAQCAVEGRPLSVRNRSGYRPWIHVQDAATAVVEALTEWPASVYNVATEHRTIGEVADLVCRLCPGSTIVEDRDIPDDDPGYQVNTFRLIGTGFRSQWTLERGLEDLLRRLESAKR